MDGWMVECMVPGGWGRVGSTGLGLSSLQRALRHRATGYRHPATAADNTTTAVLEPTTTITTTELM